MQDIHSNSAAPEQPYPHKLHFADPNRCGILLGDTCPLVPLANWCRTVLPGHFRPLIQVTRALVDNAHRHSRSGLPDGTVRLVLDRTRPLLPHLYVTDEGPRPGMTSLPYPRLEPHAWHSGLALVERNCVYWDFSWSWDGHRIRALTMQVVFDLSDLTDLAGRPTLTRANSRSNP